MSRSSRAKVRSPFSPLPRRFHQARQEATNKGCPHLAGRGARGMPRAGGRASTGSGRGESASVSGARASAGESLGGDS
eukprot:45814-Alexandrium_andersonii.AAC.1